MSISRIFPLAANFCFVARDRATQARPNSVRAWMLVALCLVTAGAARATPAIQTANNNGRAVNATDFAGASLNANVGWDFTTGAAPLVVGKLGLYDHNGDGLSAAHQVGLWKSDGTLVASATVPAGTASTLTNSYRFVAITPVTLAANTSYTIGALFPRGDADQFLVDSSQTFADGLTYNASVQLLSANSSLARPTTNRGGHDQGIFGPNFDFDVAQSGTTFTVNQTDDHDDGVCGVGDCTLREAINAANKNGAGTDTITFDADVFDEAQTITLARGEISITASVTIEGPGARLLSVDAANANRVFGIGAGNTWQTGPPGSTTTISGLTLVKGRNGDSNGGGALFNEDTVTLNNCTLSGNTAGRGGAISNKGTLTLNSCTLSGNTSRNSGGAIYNSGTLTLNSCTLSGNTSDAFGGGILSVGTLTLNSSTLSGNSARSGGGILIFSGAFNLSNTIVAGNTAGTNPDLSGTINSGDYNLIGNSQGTIFGASANHNVINVDAQLGPLKNNGGPTDTIALLPGSPAINAGDPNFVGASQFDQRGAGFARVQGGRLDIGAFEVQNAQPTVKDFSVAPNEDTTFIFATSDFNNAYSDPENDALQSVGVDSLPTGGTLNFDGKPVTAGQIIAAADLGKLTFVPAANFNGATTFDFNGSDAFGFAAKSARLTLNVTAVNDAPAFNVGANQIVAEDAGSQLVTGFATQISAGANNESGQKLEFIVSNDNSALFSSQPEINAAGNLIYRGADNASGVATVSVVLKDDGGVLRGGVDTSAPQTFTITVNAVNDAPVAGADSYTTDDNVTLTVSAADGVLANDDDIDSANLTAVLDQNVSRGSLTLNADGSFSYVPERGATYTTAFSYRASDGTRQSAPVNVTLGVNVTPQEILFGVSITPKAPTTNSVLTATPVILDAAGVSFSYAWSVNGALKQDGPSNSFDLSVAGQGDKGDKISVVVTATRGIDGGEATNLVQVFNSAPFAFSQSGAANAATPTVFTLRGADFDREVLTFKRVGGPTNGTATIVNNADGTATLTYSARRDFGGVEVIRFVSVDESGKPSQPATLAINVTAQAPAPLPNRAPSANNVTASTRSGVLVKVPLSGSDPDGDALTFKRVGGPTNGTGEIARDSDGVFKMFYTPRTGFVGNEIIRFVALDSQGKPSPVATITINVSGANSANGALQSAPSAANS